MDLWIKSQDKKRLIPNPNLYAVYSKEMNKAYIGDTIVGHIAEYSTEERALEVLDEIQEQMMLRTDRFFNTDDKTNYFDPETGLYRDKNLIIYEMPKE